MVRRPCDAGDVVGGILERLRARRETCPSYRPDAGGMATFKRCSSVGDYMAWPLQCGSNATKCGKSVATYFGMTRWSDLLWRRGERLCGVDNYWDD
jgi:hypothetical protein